MSDPFRAANPLWYIIIISGLVLNFAFSLLEMQTKMVASDGNYLDIHFQTVCRDGLFEANLGLEDGVSWQFTWYNVDMIPINYIGPIGGTAYYIGSYHPNIAAFLNLFALVAHVGESVYAFYLCLMRKYSFQCTYKWFLQTIILGYASLRLLLKEKDR